MIQARLKGEIRMLRRLLAAESMEQSPESVSIETAIPEAGEPSISGNVPRAYVIICLLPH